MVGAIALGEEAVKKWIAGCDRRNDSAQCLAAVDAVTPLGGGVSSGESRLVGGRRSVGRLAVEVEVKNHSRVVADREVETTCRQRARAVAVEMDGRGSDRREVVGAVHVHRALAGDLAARCLRRT